ncbi:MAG: hypothetical protein ACFE89_12900 [Candidatus Hodarchaeota archaeon]
MGFWLNTLTRKMRMPYPVFFGLVALVSYLLGVSVMIGTDNLARFLTQLNWVFLAVIGAFSGMFVVFIYRKFLDSLDDVKPLVGSEKEFEELKSQAMQRLSHWLQWVPVLFWIVVNLVIFLEPTTIIWEFYGSYNQVLLVAIYYQVAALPANIFGGIFMYMVPFGVTVAYRDICTKTEFSRDRLLSEWMAPFGGFRNLITLALLITGIYSIMVLLTYTDAPSIFPYSSILIMIIPTLVLPHYYFHHLFSHARSAQLDDVRQELLKIPIEEDQDSSRRILLLLEEARIERKRTWLIDIVTAVEILVVALMHVLLVEILTLVFHI